MRTATLAAEKQIHHLPAVAPLSGGQGEDMATKKPTYAEQLKNPKWQKKRLEVLESSGWKCSACSATEKTLHVHHKQYIKGRMAWEYENDQLAVLCEECHEDEHAMRDALDEVLGIGSILPGGSSTVALAAGIAGGIAIGLGGRNDIELVKKLLMCVRHEFYLGYVIASLGPGDIAHAARAKHNPPDGSPLDMAIKTVLGEED